MEKEIRESLEKIKNEWLENLTNGGAFVGLQYKIRMLENLAIENLDEDSSLLRKVINTRKNICN